MTMDSRLRGGGHKVLRLILIIILSIGHLWAFCEPTEYRGRIAYYDFTPDQLFTMGAVGAISLDGAFSEYWLNGVDPLGRILLATDPSYFSDPKIKWYRIEGDSLIESNQPLPVDQAPSIVWASAPFRIIIADYTVRVWQLHPNTLTASCLSSYDIPQSPGFAVLAPALKYLYFNYADDFYLRRLNYDDRTGIVSGPMTSFPTPNRGGRGMVGTSDGRLMVALDGDAIMVHRIDDQGVPHTEYYLDLFGMRNLMRVAITPNDRFAVIIGLDDNTINTFTLSLLGTISPITQLTGFTNAEALAFTNDGKFLVVAHHFKSSYPEAILSVFLVNDDGSLTYLPDKDFPVAIGPSSLFFFPPPQWPTAANSWTMYE